MKIGFPCSSPAGLGDKLHRDKRWHVKLEVQGSEDSEPCWAQKNESAEVPWFPKHGDGYRASLGESRAYSDDHLEPAQDGLAEASQLLLE